MERVYINIDNSNNSAIIIPVYIKQVESVNHLNGNIYYKGIKYSTWYETNILSDYNESKDKIKKCLDELLNIIKKDILGNARNCNNDLINFSKTYSSSYILNSLIHLKEDYNVDVYVQDDCNRNVKILLKDENNKYSILNYDIFFYDNGDDYYGVRGYNVDSNRTYYKENNYYGIKF